MAAQHSGAQSSFQVENIIGGMRGLKAMLWEASVLDPNEARLSLVLKGRA
jgi:hypothetical protein